MPRGAWSAIDESFDKNLETYDFLDIENDDDEPVPITVEAPKDVDGLALSSTDPGLQDVIWDLYDSGASHHMYPYHDEFLTFEPIPAYPLSAVNKETFQAHGVGSIDVLVPNGENKTRIRLMKVLYTPDVGYGLISVGKIDDAGYYSTFGGSHCIISNGDGEVVGTIPKSNGVYRTPHSVPFGLASAAMKPSTLRELHGHLGHIGVDAVTSQFWLRWNRDLKLSEALQSTPCYNTVQTPALCIHDTLDMFIFFLPMYLVRHLPYARFIRTTSFPYTIPLRFPYAHVFVLHMTPSLSLA